MPFNYFYISIIRQRHKYFLFLIRYIVCSKFNRTFFNNQFFYSARGQSARGFFIIRENYISRINFWNFDTRSTAIINKP